MCYYMYIYIYVIIYVYKWITQQYVSYFILACVWTSSEPVESMAPTTRSQLRAQTWQGSLRECAKQQHEGHNLMWLIMYIYSAKQLEIQIINTI